MKKHLHVLIYFPKHKLQQEEKKQITEEELLVSAIPTEKTLQIQQKHQLLQKESLHKLYAFQEESEKKTYSYVAAQTFS